MPKGASDYLAYLYQTKNSARWAAVEEAVLNLICGYGVEDGFTFKPADLHTEIHAILQYKDDPTPGTGTAKRKRGGRRGEPAGGTIAKGQWGT